MTAVRGDICGPEKEATTAIIEEYRNKMKSTIQATMKD